ncbi:ABC transporter permease [Paludibacterium purpuratum]|uniref:Osmoprotectant transport system permease protein n=1 Tax=Paludibacterium purpuratum TaxID=1144873 RepID=A0A4R7B6Y7_9NEIS|nr:ABC transporter permease [Paludibacterium purpuratum]TDR80233.1 osmoprotectant transport system permease protein [Paludibacterium purpuratum]
MSRTQRALSFCLLALLGLAYWLPRAEPVFAVLFPGRDRLIYRQDTFVDLLVAHLWIVGVSSGLAALAGVGVALAVRRAWGRAFRPLLETLLAISQALPPVAVLAVATPLIGFGPLPALIALFLYGLLPIAQGTLAGLDSVPASAREVACGLGMTPAQILRHVELPLASPVILAGIRTSVTINIGTAALASTVGVKTLGLPIIIGLSGFNTPYVVQGALMVGLLALTVDQAFAVLAQPLRRWREPDGQETLSALTL